MGAVISMRGRIKSRNALLDIGAAGPLAGMVIAIPTMVIGLVLSSVKPVTPGPHSEEGQSILYWLVKRAVLGPMPEGHDVILHPTALAAWVGFLITMINMLPWGQLDGGHVAYALLGERQNRIAKYVRWALLPLLAYNFVIFVLPVLRDTPISSADFGAQMKLASNNASFWGLWLILTLVIGRYAGDDHPPTDDSTLSPFRKVVAVGTLVMYVLLFMPTPWAQYR